MQIPANNERPCVEILAVSFCQSGKKARVFWKFTLSDVVHLQHDAKDFGSVPNLATSEGWIRNVQIYEMRKTYPERTEWQKPTWLNSLTSPSLPSDFQKMKKPNSSTLKAWGQDPGHYLGGDGDGSGGDDEVDEEGGGGGRWQSFEKQGCRENCFSGPFNDPFEYLWPSLLIANHILGIIKTSIDYRLLW